MMIWYCRAAWIGRHPPVTITSIPIAADGEPWAWVLQITPEMARLVVLDVEVDVAVAWKVTLESSPRRRTNP